jgi:molecular chaperone HscB
MDYFMLFDIPVSFNVNSSLVKQKFYQLSRMYHPDFFTDASVIEQEAVLEKSSLINKAFLVLNNPDLLMEYILTEKKIITTDEKFQLPNSFLMEVMEINEQLLEAKMENDSISIEKLKVSIEQLNQTIYEPIQTIVENYQEDITSQEAMLQVKTYYYQKKYLKRILESLK